jgi:hypothetical protein
MKRCVRCGFEFDPAKNGPEACRYHPGELCDYDAVGKLGSLTCPGDFWDCCMKMVAIGKDESGCARGPHIAATK